MKDFAVIYKLRFDIWTAGATRHFDLFQSIHDGCLPVFIAERIKSEGSFIYRTLNDSGHTSDLITFIENGSTTESNLTFYWPAAQNKIHALAFASQQILSDAFAFQNQIVGLPRRQ